MSGDREDEPTRAGNPYQVGYKKPPKHTQFGPGNRGNRSGRPKGTKNLKTDLAEELREKIRVLEGGKPRTLSKQRAIVKGLLTKAMKGDTRAINIVLNLNMRLLGMDEAETSATELNAEDQEILDLVLKRAARQKGSVELDE